MSAAAVGAAELVAQERERLRLLVAGETGAARELHHPEFQLITPIGLALSREEYLGAIDAGMIEYRLWQPGEILVRGRGESAQLRYRARLEMAFSGHLVTAREYWHSDTYERVDGRWQTVWSQATEVARR